MPGTDRSGTTNADGVALAAIQGLARRKDRLQEEIETFEDRIEAHAERIEALDAESERKADLIDALEAHLATEEVYTLN